MSFFVQIAKRLGFPISEEPVVVDLNAQMLAEGWIPITRAAVIAGVDVSFFMDSVKILKAYPRDDPPDRRRVWVKAEAVEQLRAERTFSVPSAPRPQASLGPVVMAEATFGLNDLTARPGSDEVDRLRAHDSTSPAVPVSVEKVTVAAYTDREK